MKPIRIFFTIPNFVTAGSGRAMLNIIERLDPEIFSPAVCVSQKGGKLDAVVDKLSIPFLEAPFSVPAKPYIGLLPRAWQAAQAFRPYHFDIWHSFNYTDDYSEAIIARLAGARAWIFTKKNMGWGSRTWYLRALMATRIAAQNTDMLRDFFARPPLKAKTRFVQRGVDPTHFDPEIPPRLRLRSELGIGSAPLLATVAHLLPVKGHPTLLDALAQVPGTHLLLAGNALDDTYAAGLQDQVVAVGIAERVHFLGGVADVPALLAEVDVFVLPTWAKWRMEGCPVALLEAMASGKACVASDIPGTRDLIVNGESGRLVLPEDSQALAAVLNELIADAEQRARLGKFARQRVMQQFTIEHEVSRHTELYLEIMGQAR